jgi:ketosteroid isomerase-like protein
MSLENVNLTRAGVAAIKEAFKTGDLGPWARHVEAAFDPEIVLESGTGAFTEGEWRGHDGAVQYIANAMDVLDDMWLRTDEEIDVDDELLVLVVTFGGCARYSGIDFENRVTHVFGFQAGKVTSWQVFLSREEALRAIGVGDTSGRRAV